MRRPVLPIITVLGALLVGERATAQSPSKHPGLNLFTPPDSALPNEQVDPAWGALTVVATDLVLPGNAGLISRCSGSTTAPCFPITTPAAPRSRRIRGRDRVEAAFWRIIHADSTSAGQMQVEMATGAGIRCITRWRIPTSGRPSGFWLYNPATHTLQLPDRQVYMLDREVALNERLGTVRYVTEIRDRFQNRITFGYFDTSGPADGVAIVPAARQRSQIREVTFTYDATHKALASMTYLDHTWNYDQTAQGEAGHSKLDRVRPPQGPATLYEYNGAELAAIVAPFSRRFGSWLSRRCSPGQSSLDNHACRRNADHVGTWRANGRLDLCVQPGKIRIRRPSPRRAAAPRPAIASTAPAVRRLRWVARRDAG